MKRPERDLHTEAIHRDNPPQVRACTDDPETVRMARAFDAPVLINAALVDGSIRKALARRGIPIVVEGHRRLASWRTPWASVRPRSIPPHRHRNRAH
ncbi:MAG: hypothetical protein LC647_10375 [Beggiatoa sp.]|nr:hypothetical protein [Beggiatoa sp.]